MNEVKLLDVLQAIVEDAIPVGMYVHRNDMENAIYIGFLIAGHSNKPNPNINIIASIVIHPKDPDKILVNTDWYSCFNPESVSFSVSDPNMPTWLAGVISKMET